MREYVLHLDATAKMPSERIVIRGNDPSVAFGWAERNLRAHGRTFEILENGRSLGRAQLAGTSNFWILTSPRGLLAERPVPTEAVLTADQPGSGTRGPSGCR